MDFEDILEKLSSKPAYLQKNIQNNDAYWYMYKIAKRLAEILPENYDVDEVAKYCSIPDSNAGANLEKVKKTFLNNQRELTKLKNHILTNKQIKTIVSVPLILGLLNIIKETLPVILDESFSAILMLILVIITFIYCFSRPIND